MSKPNKATVLWFNKFKGFGFAELEDESLVFIHGEQLGGNQEGLKIPIEILKGMKLLVSKIIPEIGTDYKRAYVINRNC